jgi:hypothetical protein
MEANASVTRQPAAILVNARAFSAARTVKQVSKNNHFNPLQPDLQSITGQTIDPVRMGILYWKKAT